MLSPVGELSKEEAKYLVGEVSCYQDNTLLWVINTAYFH